MRDASLAPSSRDPADGRPAGAVSFLGDCGDQRAGEGLEPLVALLAGRQVVALTGAGCSTESGIPDYRGPGSSGAPRHPIQHDAFLRRPEVRQRYWARATRGWPTLAAARPNPAHLALAALERAGALVGVITQNVDRLHHQAGSQNVIELHGALADVACLGCGAHEPRARLHARLLAANPAFAAGPARPTPDGDAELGDDHTGFRVLPCEACGGVLKPDVVFFGGTVAPMVVEAALALVREADVLLVVGSSLTVFSGFRFVRRAHDWGVPIGIVNLGPSRGDPLAAVRVDARAGQVLPALARAFSRIPYSMEASR